MMQARPIRLALDAMLVATTFLGSALPAHSIQVQQKPSAVLPATAPTTVASPPPEPAAPLTPAQRPARRAEIKYTQGQLAVTAENASLNQILREIGRTTGIKITGGVAEERVFGSYGPSPASDVLDALLDGTGSNVLLIRTDDGSPGELILTPRHGGPTPPNPNAPGFDDEGPSGDDNARQQPPVPAAVPFVAGQPLPNQQAPTPPAAAQPAPAAATDPSDPNAVKTPQQIFDQLQRLRQQPQQQQPQPQ